MNKKPSGWSSGLFGVIIFSGSLPATRLAVVDFSPVFLTSARAVVAAILGITLLLIYRQTFPSRNELFSLVVVAIGVVVGFPLLTALALQHITASHSIVFIGLLPLSTAIFGVLRGGDRPKPAFWLFSGIGAATVAGFAFLGSSNGSMTGDLLMLAAIVVCGWGYAEGATLSRRLGGWQVISWALIMSLPMTALVASLNMPSDWSAIGTPAWVAFGYVSAFSMFIGFFFWYRGLALGGIAGVGQLQLLQPFFGFMLAAIILDEPVVWTMIASTVIVVLCVIGAKRLSPKHIEAEQVGAGEAEEAV